jgi:protein required for attachment to host cells
VIQAEVEDIPASRDLGSDAPGRLFSSRGGVRSAIEPTDWHEIEKENFARHIAQRINSAAESGEMKEVVIIAPPRVLGEIRRELSARAQGKVKGELDRDLTHHPLPEIEKALAREYTRA